MHTQIEKCRQLIAQSLNNSDSSLWNTEDFENLSGRIFEKTGVQLSLSTLKRIWGKVNYSSTPSMATLNTLARFLDYESWRDFERKNGETGQSIQSFPEESLLHPLGLTDRSDRSSLSDRSVPADPLRAEGPALPPKKGKRFLVPILLGTSVCLIAGLALTGSFRSGKMQGRAAFPSGQDTGSLFKGPRSTGAGSTDSGSSAPRSTVKFESRKTSDDLPNSVVFDYDASGFGTDSVYIQQSWDANRREKVAATGRQHTSLYYYPGYFDAKLIINGHAQKHSPVFIKTKGWEGIVETRPVPIYLTTAEISYHRSLRVSAGTLSQKTGSAVFTNTWVAFANVREFEEIDAGHFTMETTLRNTSTVEQSPCRKINITILGKKSAIIVPLAAKGCISDLQLLTGDRMISGKDQDLSGLGCDFRNFQRVICRVENGHLRIFLNGELVMDTPQQRTIGDIVGFNIEFQGTGEIRQISLSSPGKPGYEEKF